jgi:hypothetical protein
MSTVAYGALTEARKSTAEGTVKESTGLGTYIDVLAALVPAEVLAAHAVILTYATETKEDPTTHKAVVSITEPGALKATFWVLLVFSVCLFFAGRWLKKGAKRFNWRGDLFRLALPPSAFVAWTMIQKNTAFDALTDWHGNGRTIFAILIAVGLSGLATLLSVSADRSAP